MPRDAPLPRPPILRHIHVVNPPLTILGLHQPARSSCGTIPSRREGENKRRRDREREGGRDGREGGRDEGREGRKKGEREEEREEGRERERERGRE